jgi:hypothetical protein
MGIPLIPPHPAPLPIPDQDPPEIDAPPPIGEPEPPGGHPPIHEPPAARSPGKPRRIAAQESAAILAARPSVSPIGVVDHQVDEMQLHDRR